MPEPQINPNIVAENQEPDPEQQALLEEFLKEQYGEPEVEEEKEKE